MLSRFLTPRMLATIALLAGLLFLGLSSVLEPPGRVVRDNPAMHVALDVGEGLISLLIAYLMAARFRDRCLLSDLLSIYALAVLGFSKLVLLGIPTVAAGTRGDLQVWSAPVGRVVGATALAVAALNNRRVSAPALSPGAISLAAAATVATIAVASGILQPTTPNEPAEPSVLWLHALTAIALAVAALGFVERAARRHDDLLAWFGAGCTLGAAARIGYVIFPAQGFDDVYIQDLLRLGFYALLLVGAERELKLYWRSRTEAAALEERRRVARDLHDGLAQELVFISGQVRRLQRSGGVAGLEQLSSAADRAVSEARRAITALTHPGVQSLADALEELAEEFESRYSVDVRLELDRSVDLRPTLREEILRIVREGMNNAVRHGSAQVILLCLSKDDGVIVEVIDDGSGFDPGAGRARHGGFGLISMRERAEAAGGELEINSRLGEGTTVRVRLPSQQE